MINGIFWGLMNGIAAILKFVVVFIMLGFIFLLPFLLKGGWLLGLFNDRNMVFNSRKRYI